MSSIRRSLVLSFAERYLGLAIATASTLIIARLLSPAEIGLYSIASAIIALAQVVRDFGVGSYLIQEPELSDTRLSAAFSMTSLLAGLLFLLTFSGAGWVAQFYTQPRLEPAVRVLALNFLMVPIGSVSMAMLRRELRYERLLFISLAASIVGFVTVLALAYGGFGSMSMAWASVANTATTAACAVYFSERRAKPALALHEWRHVLTYGSRLTLAAIVTEVAMNINDLVVGRLMGPAPVAQISRAQGLMNLMHRDLLSAVTGVMFPAIAKARREGGNVAEMERRCVAGMGVIAWPFYGFVALFPVEVLRLLYGPQWDAVATLVPIFCAAGAAAVLWKLSPAVVSAQGRADLMLRAELTIQTLRIALLAGTIALFRSLESFAIAFAVIYLISIPIWQRFRQLALGVRQDLLPLEARASIKVTLAALLLPGAIALAQGMGWLDRHAMLPFALAIVLCVASWLIAVIKLRHPLAEDALFQRLMTVLAPWRR